MWTHVASGGAVSSDGLQATLTATLSGTIAVGDIIVISLAWSQTTIPTIQDSVDNTPYMYVGTTPIASQQVATWYHLVQTASVSLPITVTANGAHNMVMTADAYSQTSGNTVAVDVTLQSSGTSSSAVISSSLIPTTSDLIYIGTSFNGAAGPPSLPVGSAFTLRYSNAGAPGVAFGIAAEDIVNSSTTVASGTDILDLFASAGWMQNAVAFKSIAQSMTLSGSTQGLNSVIHTFAVSLIGPSATAVVVSLSSNNGTDRFQATYGGPNVTTVTIPAGSLSQTFYMTTGTTGVRAITFSSGSIATTNSPFSFAALASATSYTVTGSSGGHQNAPVTWNVILVGGDFNGTITATPGLLQGQLVTPYTVTFTGNGVLSSTFSFTPLAVASPENGTPPINFAFTNSGSLANPANKTYISTGQYLLDAFAGSAGLTIQSTTSLPLADGVLGSGWTAPSSPGVIEINGSGFVYLSTSAGSALGGANPISTSNAAFTFPLAVQPTTNNFEVIFEYQNNGVTNNVWAGIQLLVGSGTWLGFAWDGAPQRFDWMVDGLRYTSAGTATNPVGTGTPVMIKLDLTPSGASTLCGVSYSTVLTYPYAWQTLNMGTTNPFAIPTSSTGTTPALGMFFASATGGTTNPFIGNLTIQDQTPPPPNCMVSPTITTPLGSTMPGAYVTSSGRSVAFFFETNGGVPVNPTVLNYAPAFFNNGNFIAAGVPHWITTTTASPCALFALPQTFSSTDNVTVTAPAGWMTCGTGNSVSALASYPLSMSSSPVLATDTYRSSFGTDTLAKTFRPGFNISNCNSVGGINVFLSNLRYRMPTTTSSGVVSAWGNDGYPTQLAAATVVIPVLDFSNYNSGIPGDTTQYPGIPGYYAVSWDDLSHGTGNRCDLAMATTNSAYSQVTQDANCAIAANPGSGGIGQYAMYKLGAVAGSGVVNLPIGVQFHMPSFSTGVNCFPNLANVTVYGPQDFTFSGTQLNFARPTLPVLSNFVGNHLPNGVGVLRFIDSLLGDTSAGNTNLAEPWELRQVTDWSFNNSLYSNAFINPTCNLTTIRALNSSTSPYLYGDGFGSSWVPLTSGSVAITLSGTLSASAGSTTFVLSGTPQAGDAPFYGVMIGIGAEFMRCTAYNSSTLTVTVQRAQFYSTGLSATPVQSVLAAHSSGASLTFYNRFAWTSLSNIDAANWQIIEFTTQNPHGFKAGQFFAPTGSYQTMTFTDGTSAPTAGTGGAGTAVLSGSTVGSITLNSGGSGYAPAPTVLFIGGGGSGAAATTTISGGVITGFTMTNHGTGYTSVPTVQVSSSFGTNYWARPIWPTGANSFAMSIPASTAAAVTLGPSTTFPSAPTSYALNPASNTVSYNQPIPNLPYETPAAICSSLGCPVHINLPFLASDQFVAVAAQKVLANWTSLTLPVYVELSDEPWNFVEQIANQTRYLSTFNSLSWNHYQWYVLRANQVGSIFRSVFGARSGQVKLMLNNQTSNPSNGAEMVSIAMANNVVFQSYANNSYYQADTDAASAAYCNQLLPQTGLGNVDNTAQICDYLIHSLMYYGNNFQDSITAPGSGHLVNIATYNAWLSTNYGSTYPPVQIYGYEGGYSEGLPEGCSLTNTSVGGYSGTVNGAGIISFATSHDIVYAPVWRQYEKDFFALIQQAGFVDNAIYGYSFPSNYENLWTVYNWAGQPYGWGDGQDGKANNQLTMATPALANSMTIGAENQDQNNVSVRGQAHVDWMAALTSGSVTLSGAANGNLGAQAAFNISLNVSAPGSGIIIYPASSQIGDTFQSTLGGPNVTSINIASGATSGTFYLTPNSGGARTISVTATPGWSINNSDSFAVNSSASGVVMLGAESITVSVSFLVNSSGAVTLGRDSITSSTGAITFASGSPTLNSESITSSAGFADSATAVITLSATAGAGSGSETQGAVGSITMGSVASTGVSGLFTGAIGSVTLDSVVVLGTGPNVMVGAATVLLGSMVPSGSALVGIVSSGDVTLGVQSVASSTSAVTSGSGALALASISIAVSATFESDAQGFLALSPLDVEGTPAAGVGASGAIVLGFAIPSVFTAFETDGSGLITLAPLIVQATFIPPISFLAALVQLLRSTSALTSTIGGQRIYSTWPGPKCPLPFVLIEDYVESQPGETIELNTIFVQIGIYGSDKQSVRAVGEALKNATDSPAQNNQSTRSPLVWYEGTESNSWREPTTKPERLRITYAGVDLYRWGIGYQFEFTPFFQL